MRLFHGTKVSVCLITYKRPKNIEKIVQHLSSHLFIDEILIRDNDKEENIMSYGRYKLMEKARNDIIYVQDDDCIVHNIQEIWKGFKKDPTRIHYGATERLFSKEKEVDGKLCLMGWGAFFKSEWVSNLKRYTDKYGKDECFHRETDRIFSILRDKNHKMYDGKIEQLDGYLSKDALSEQKDHIGYKKLAIERCLHL